MDQRGSRRLFLATACLVIATPLNSFAQEVRKIGVLSLEGRESVLGQQQQRLFRASLRKVGYVEGRNLVIEWRFAEGRGERLPLLAQDLVRANVELFVPVTSNGAVRAAKQATAKIPIVMHNAFLPVESGLVTSLARPGGNITGTSTSSRETSAKTLEILKEAVPSASRIALLHSGPTITRSAVYERVAGKLGLNLRYFDAAKPDDVEPVLAQIRAFRPDALYVSVSPSISTRMEQVAAFASDQKLVTITTAFSFVNAGGLLSYGPDIPDMWDRTASYVDRILRGAKPQDLPIEEPRKFLLIVNAKTARVIGYKIPQSLLVRADKVIE